MRNWQFGNSGATQGPAALLQRNCVSSKELLYLWVSPNSTSTVVDCRCKCKTVYCCSIDNRFTANLFSSKRTTEKFDYNYYRYYSCSSSHRRYESKTLDQGTVVCVIPWTLALENIMFLNHHELLLPSDYVFDTQSMDSASHASGKNKAAPCKEH